MSGADPDWWRGAVLYQVYPRSFRDANGDGIGDLPGLLSGLDYIASLGVDGVWLSPVFASPQRDYGYDISDYCAIDPQFGTLADFDAVVDGAHARGLKIIVDQVYSHTSDLHPWFAESRADRANPKADWYVWADPKADGSPPTNWQATFGGAAWTWDSRRRQYYLHNYLIEQPDLNLHNPEVQDAILGVARVWLDRGVDGFRLDVANCYTHDRALRDNPPSGRTDAVKPYFLQTHLYDRDRPESLQFARRLRALVDERPGRFLLAELATDRPVEITAEYTSGPDGFHTAYSFMFLGERFGADWIRKGVERLLQAAPEAWPSWAFSNHDVTRVATRWGAGRPQPQFAKLVFALLTSLRGTAFVYQGEELGLPEAEVPRERLRDPDGVAFWPAYKGRDGARTPLPWRAEAPHAGFGPPQGGEHWLPVDPRHLPLAVDRQENDPGSMLRFVRAWLAWRRAQPALVKGDIAFLDAPLGVLAFTRRTRGQAALCAFNLGETAQAIGLPAGDWREGPELGGKRAGAMLELGANSGFVAVAA